MPHQYLNRFRRALFALAFAGAFCAPVLAQTTSQGNPPGEKPAPEKRPLLDLIRHDPKRYGPLLFVGRYPPHIEHFSQNEAGFRESVSGKTPAQFATLAGQRVLTVGGITAFVPLTMKEIVKNPGKPDPFAGLRFNQRFTVLLGTLTREQWQQAAGANGIGLSALSDEQRSLFAGVWRKEALKMTAVRSRGRLDEIGWESNGSVAVSDLRFRVSRRVTLALRVAGKEGVYLYKPDDNFDGPQGELQPDGTYLRYELETPDEYPNANSEETVSAFGVPVIVTVPNRPKAGHLNLDAPALNVGMRLDSSHKTLGQLLAAVAGATGTRLVPDKRISDLPVGYKIAVGGQTVSTGDVLKVLCRSVTGTFRRLDGPNGPIYLLTDDVEGIGTRFARLERWAEKPSRERMEISRKAVDDCAEQEPLDLLGFAPGYAHTLPAEQMKVIDESYRSGDWAKRLTVPVGELSPALQKEFNQGLESWRKWNSKEVMRTDAVSLETDFHCDWIVPNGRTYPARLNGEIGSMFMRQIAVPKPKRKPPVNTGAYKHPLPTKFPASLKRRVLTAALPETEEALRDLFSLLRRKGFTEAWFRAEDDDAKTVERLKSAVALGKKSNLRVGVVIPWLLKEMAGAKSGEDVNILGETGNDLVEVKLRSLADAKEAEKERTYYADRNGGWAIPGTQSATEIIGRAAPFLQIAGLSAAVFSNLTAPGYTGNEQFGNDGYDIEERLGYNDPLRFRCVAEKGFDPVDVSSSSYSHLGVSGQLPLFPSYIMAKPLGDLRHAQMKAHIARIYAALRDAHPALTLYADNKLDRMSYFSFYGRWEKGGGLSIAQDRFYSDPKQLRETAFRSPSPILAMRGYRNTFMESHLWNNWHDAAREASDNGWGGFAVIMPDEPLAEVTALLEKLPDAPRPAL